MSYEILSPETVQQLRDAGPKDLLWLICDSHEALRERVAQFERHVEEVVEPELIRRANWLYADADAKYHQILSLEDVLKMVGLMLDQAQTVSEYGRILPYLDAALKERRTPTGDEGTQ